MAGAKKTEELHYTLIISYSFTFDQNFLFIMVTLGVEDVFNIITWYGSTHTRMHDGWV